MSRSVKFDYLNKTKEHDIFLCVAAEEVFEIGRVCVEVRNLYSALNNFQRAKEMFEEQNNKDMAMQAYDYLAFVMHEVSYSITSEVMRALEAKCQVSK